MVHWLLVKSNRKIAIDSIFGIKRIKIYKMGLKICNKMKRDRQIQTGHVSKIMNLTTMQCLNELRIT